MKFGDFSAIDKRADKWAKTDAGKAWLARIGGVPLAPPQRRAVRRDELLRALRLPANARIQFGGREWLQDFDDSACLIVTVPR